MKFKATEFKRKSTLVYNEVLKNGCAGVTHAFMPNMVLIKNEYLQDIVNETIKTGDFSELVELTK